MFVSTPKLPSRRHSRSTCHTVSISCSKSVRTSQGEPCLKVPASDIIHLARAAHFLPFRPLVFGFIVAQRPPQAFGSLRLLFWALWLHLPWHAGGSVRAILAGGGFLFLCCGPGAHRPPHALGSV